MLIPGSLGFLKRLMRIIQAPVKGLSNKDTARDQEDTGKKSSLKNNLIGETKRARSIRKREFDKLRALRWHQAATGEKQRQYFFHTSMPSKAEERTDTLKKIDEVEVQMSMQWWKTDRLDFPKDKCD